MMFSCLYCVHSTFLDYKNKLLFCHLISFSGRWLIRMIKKKSKSVQLNGMYLPVQLNQMCFLLQLNELCIISEIKNRNGKTLFNCFKLNQENSCKSAHVLQQIKPKCEHKSLMFSSYFPSVPAATDSISKKGHTRSDGHTRLWESESQFRFVCPILSIKPPLVATWLGGSGFTAVDMDRK